MTSISSVRATWLIGTTCRQCQWTSFASISLFLSDRQIASYSVILFLARFQFPLLYLASLSTGKKKTKVNYISFATMRPNGIPRQYKAAFSTRSTNSSSSCKSISVFSFSSESQKIKAYSRRINNTRLSLLCRSDYLLQSSKKIHLMKEMKGRMRFIERLMALLKAINFSRTFV